MSVALRPVRPPRRLVELLERLGGAALVVAVGVMLGLQYIAPNKRVLSSLAATVLFGIAWRIDTLSGLGILALALPFPRGTVFGSTNLAFVLLLLVIWLLRISTGQAAAPRRTAVDIPVIALYTAYVVSFYNVETTEYLTRALERFELMVACVLMFYLIVNNVRSENDLRRLHVFQAVAATLVCLLAVYELSHPGGTFIHGWIDFHATAGDDFNLHDVRVGSSFYDFELLSEFCALNLLFAVFLVSRARSLLGRLLTSGFLLLMVFILFATTTRGSIVSLAVAGAYFLFLVRRRLSVVSFTVITTSILASFFTMNWFVSTFTRSGSVLKRLDQTKFVNGLPDSRAEAWPSAFQRMLEHPYIGHGPYYSAERGIHTWTWPHCLYLYVGNNVGFIGLAIFLWLLYKLWRISKPLTDDLRDPSYARAFLLIAHVQMVTFAVDQIKIEYLRNFVYQFQVWWMFALVVATYQVATRTGAAAGSAPARALRRP